MKTILLAAAAALSIGASAAYADGGQHAVNTELSGVVAQTPAQNAPSIAAAQNGQAGQTYSHSNHGTWLFPPIGKYLDQQARG